MADIIPSTQWKKLVCQLLSNLAKLSTGKIKPRTSVQALGYQLSAGTLAAYHKKASALKELISDS